jgi:hypothetical protein
MPRSRLTKKGAVWHEHALRQVTRLPAQKSAGNCTKSAGNGFSRQKKKCCICSSRGRSLPALFKKCHYIYFKTLPEMPPFTISGTFEYAAESFWWHF